MPVARGASPVPRVPLPGAGPAGFAHSLAVRAVAAFVVAAAAAAAVTTLTSSSGGAGAPPARAPQAEVARVPPAEAVLFAILRRPLTAADGFLELHPGAGIHGANPALARTVSEPAGGLSAGFVSVVPANGAVCLRVPRVPYPQAGVVWWCQPSAQAARGRLIVALLRGGPHPPSGGDQRIVGLVPDGVRFVTVAAVGGVTRRVAVRANVYDAQLRAPRTISFTLPGGRAVAVGAP